MVEEEIQNNNHEEKSTSRLESLEEKASTISTDEYKNAEEIPYVTQKVKLRWSRVFLVAIILTIFLTGISVIIIWRVSIDREQVILFSPMFFFIECGLLLIFGGCIGTIKQSFTIDFIKVKLMKGEKISFADTKIAIGSAYSYILTGVFLGVVSLIAYLIVNRVIYP
ncbi:MAG: hypothetical protein FK734_13125 [Asgard group archaeon]|nr:hypothetical protein [Asgard group archaeon]